jgi:UDP-N-acetylmuramate dehydrogenase
MEKNFSLLGLNTFGFDVKAKFFEKVQSLDDVRNLIGNQDFKDNLNKSRVLVLSGGSNILFSSGFYDGFVVYPDFKGIETLDETAEQVKIRCYGGEVWKDFVDYTVAHNLYGLENLADIPGKVGAAPVQNIGAYGAEVKDTICQVHTIDLISGEIKVFDNAKCEFSYRNSIFKKFEVRPLIFAVDFILKKHSELKLDYGNIRNYLASNGITHPTLQDVATTVKTIRAEKLPEVGVVGSVGSFFQNAIVSIEKYQEIKQLYPEVPSYPVESATASTAMIKIPSGWLIDRAGWKGYRENHVGVWDKQALVLVHYGGGKPQEILNLMKKIQDSVYQKFGIAIMPEVNIA